MNHPETIPSLVRGKIVFHETSSLVPKRLGTTELKDIGIWKRHFMIKCRAEFMEALVSKGRLSFKSIKIMRAKPARCNRHTYLKNDFKINAGRSC